MTLLCRNEIDIIKAHLDFHLALGVTAIIVTDNASCDGTYDFLLNYAKQHPIDVINEPELNHDQGRWVSRMAHHAFIKYGPSWLIHSDADEFWVPNCGSLPSCFASFPADARAISVPRRNMLPPPIPDSQPGLSFYSQMLIKEAFSFNALGEPLPAKVCHVAMPRVVIGEGNHKVFQDDHLIAAAPADGLEIIHFPVRTLEQLERKVRDGSQALSHNTALSDAVGSSWKHLDALLKREGTLRFYYRSLRPGEPVVRAGLHSGRYQKEARIFHALTSRAAAFWTQPDAPGR